MNPQGDRLSTSDIANAGRIRERHEPAPPHPQDANTAHPADRPLALFDDQEGEEMRRRWDHIQTGFVDEPRRSVQDADQLVAAAIQRLAQSFSEERGRLEQQWDRDGNISTEDLRLAFQRYRSFFQRLLSL